MPTLEETIDDILLQLNENAIVVTGIRHDTDISRARAEQAIVDIVFTRVNVRAYTDERIQEVLDLLTTTLTAWAESVLAQANGHANSVGNNVINQITGDWNDWQNWVQGEIDSILADYNIMEQWAQDTFSIEIPRIIAEVEAMIEEVRKNEQDILNEVGTSRQETAEMASRWRQIADEITETKNKIIEMDYSIYELKEELHRNISLEFDDRFAFFDERITIAVGDAGAVADRVEQLGVEVGDQYALVQNVERAMIDGDEALAVQIQSLSVGTNTQFDPFIIWHFDTNNEGWNGTWDDGFLVSGSTTNSPTIALNGNQYRQLRMRLKRVGNPTWNGNLSWTGGGGGSETIIEPTWGGDLGETTVNTLWNGTITQLNIEFGIVDDDNYYMIDWVTVGRPSPGASTASVNTERLARITADSALGLRIDVIELDYVTNNGAQVIATNVINGIKSEIIEDAITGAVSVVNNEMTLLELRIDNVETGLTTNSSAINTLTNRVDIIDNEFTAVNSEITQLKIDFNDMASSEVISGLTQRLTAVENSITIVNTDFTNLNATVSELPGNISQAQSLAQSAMNVAGGKGKVFVQNSAPPVSERLPQNLWIDTTGGANTPKRWDGQAWEAVTDKVARDAAQAAASALAGLGSKAENSVVSALTQRVETAEGLLSSQATSLTSLNSSLTLVVQDVNGAHAAAQTAYNLAEARGRVWYQTMAPPASGRLPQNLWIDTNNGNNTPKRWDASLNQWVVVTDKVALDAAAAAASALQQLAAKADASALTSLTSRVAQTESGLTSQANSITSLSGSITATNTELSNVRDTAINAASQANTKGKVFFQNSAPPASERLPQNLWIFTGNNANTPRRWNGSAWVDVSDAIAVQAAANATAAIAGLANKADVSAVTALDTKITNIGSTLSSVASRTSTLESRINNSSTGLNALANSIDQVRTNVTSVNNTVTAQANNIQSIQSQVNDSSASGLFRVQTLATQAGSQSRVGISARTTQGNTSQSASIFLESKSNGLNQVTIVADRFSFVNHSGVNATETVPFFIRNGVTYIRTAIIDDLSIGRGKIGNNQITMQWGTTSDQVTINLAHSADVIIFTSARVKGTNNTHDTRYEITRNNNFIASSIFSVSQYTYPYTWFHSLRNLPAGNHTFRFSYSEQTEIEDTRIVVFGAYK